jgi:hypothetical protein
VNDERKKEKTGEIVFYQPDGEVKLEVRIENDTVWLSQAQNRAKRVSQNQAYLILGPSCSRLHFSANGRNVPKRQNCYWKTH